MVLGLVSTEPLMIPASAEITGTGTMDITLSYPANVQDENRDDVATMVSGGGIPINVETKGSFTEGQPSLRVSASDRISNPATGSIGDEKYVKTEDSGGSSGKMKSLHVFSEIDQYLESAGRNDPAARWGILSIKGNYVAKLTQGNASEKAPDLGSEPTTVKSIQEIPIMEPSGFKITCGASQGDLAQPIFRLSSDRDDAYGLFVGAKEIRDVKSTGADNTATNPLSLKGKNILSFTLVYDEDGNDASARFEVPLNQVHIQTYKLNEDGSYQVDQNGKKIPETYNNYIAAGTEISVAFSPPTSTNLLLNVLTPKEAVCRIADAIAQDSGQTDKNGGEFIRFQTGNKKLAITKAFDVRTRVSRYNEPEDFEIKWTFKATDFKECSQDEADNAIQIDNDADNGSGYVTARVNPQYYDIKGNLQATVYYRGQGEPAEQKTGEIGILIRGKGKPPTVKQHKQATIGESNWYKFSGAERDKVPSTLNMDAYDGTIEGYDKKDPSKPFKYVLELNMGKDNAMAQYVVIEAIQGDGSILTLSSSENPDVNYEPVALGGQISNPKADTPSQEGKVYLQIAANDIKPAQNVTLQITFYVKDADDVVGPGLEQPRPIEFHVQSTWPDNDATLGSISIENAKKEPIEYEFISGQTEYMITVPYEIEKIKFTPKYNDSNKYTAGDNPIVVTVTPQQDGWNEPRKIASSKTTPFIKLTENSTAIIELMVTAENPNSQMIYTYKIFREPARANSSLSTLQLLDEDGTTDYMPQAIQGKLELPNAATGFDPKVKDYVVNVPFKTTKLQVLATPEDEFISDQTYDPALGSKNLLPFPPYNWLKLNDPEQDPTVLKITIVPQNENPDDQSVYTLTINHNPPSEDATLSALSVIDGTDDAKSFPYTPAFHGEMEEEDFYTVEPLPYLQEKIRISAKPTDPTTTMKLVYDGNEMDFSEKTPSKPIKVPYSEDGETPYVVQVVTTAENGNNITYPLHIVRNPPSTDASLTALAVADQDGGAVALDPDFNAETYTYTMSVPYETQKVAVTATTGYAGAALRIDGKKATSGEASSLIKLKYPGTTTIAVEVTAEDEKTVQKYTLKITRQKPSNDARLKSLAVTGIEEGTLKPIFVPDTLDYTANVAVGQKGVVITAIPNHKYATLKIDGKVVKNGEPSELIELMKVKQKILIEVTAQDGKTKKTYSITFTDMNKIELTDNANLKSLVVKPGVISPKFTPSATSYDVAVKEDVASVQIIPKPDDELAKVQVFFGSKEIGDWDGNFIQTIADGENAFTVTVTSPSGKVTKDYTILVHRNDEDNMQTLKPITAEDINFEQTGDVVLVDITKYTRVAADVFNTIKEEFPEKTIVFEGNDYSLEFKGEDLDTIVPHTEIFDFALRFTSPEENDIMNIADRYPENEGTRMVFVYFDHHGALPAPATFTVSLGSPYSEETLFWHYYNPERDRIDYYGNVKTNSKGTFAVKIDHLSTYIVADERIAGSENKAGATAASTGSLAATAGESLSDAAAASKPNPGTGVEGEGAQ